MAKTLTAGFVRRAADAGRYYDTNGLFLRVQRTGGGKQWMQRLTVNGRVVELGLGGWPLVTLEEAREAAFENRRLARRGGDPLAAKREGKAPTFADALGKVVAMHEGAWRDGTRTEHEWRSSMDIHAMPRLGRRPVDAITAADVLAVLAPIWNTKRETARKVRRRIGAVMKWAVAQGWRDDNPAGDAIGDRESIGPSRSLERRGSLMLARSGRRPATVFNQGSNYTAEPERSASGVDQPGLAVKCSRNRRQVRRNPRFQRKSTRQ